MNTKIILFSVVLALLLSTSCDREKKIENPFLSHISEVKSEFAADKRVALFHVEVIKNNSKYILKGESDLPDAISALKQKLLAENLDYIDSIQLLPAKDLEEKTRAIINISVANLRSAPKHSAELATQATLGTPLKVLKKEGGWYYIQTPDKYLSWVDDGGIELMNEQRAVEWKSAAKIIYLKTYGHAYSTNKGKQAVSDMVAGCVLEVTKVLNKYYKVKYPDGRQAFVLKSEAEMYNEWLENLEPSTENLVETSKTLMGVPYLWGGTSTKGMDCSGFTKTIYFLNGMVIPRDASQQVRTGKSIDSVLNFESLQKGDLLFFGRKATDSTSEKVVHVGMWIGNNEFIHASNMVRVSSMDPNAENFDQGNRKRYLRTKRILKEEGEDLINLMQTPLFKD